jgi:hypothetical protein
MYASTSIVLKGWTVVEPPIVIEAVVWTGVDVGVVAVVVAVGDGLLLVHPSTRAHTPIIAMVSNTTTNFLLYIRLFTLCGK